MERHRLLSKKDQEAANRFGGSDKDSWQDYIKIDTVPYYDKPDHLQRSIVSHPAHIKYIKK